MQLWRLSSARRARDFDGGYGLLYPGRWNSAGRPVTYCATVPSLAALEKRVHVLDPGNLPPLAMVEYEASDDLPQRTIALGELPADWRARDVDTQRRGDAWLEERAGVLLFVPSVIVPLERARDLNILINHRHPRAAEIRIASVTDFTLDPRLFAA
jgi:RES domain-containing protein